MRETTRLFYRFSGAHSLLIGLLPFFLPALLWNNGLSLAEISWFIALAGFSYSSTLLVWDQLRARFGYRSLILGSFLFELAVVVAMVGDPNVSLFYVSAVLYGVYGCFYWMTQRLLFLDCTTQLDTGKKFGNLQIIVTVLLKVGILAGGFLWDHWGASSVFWCTLILIAPMLGYCLLARFPVSSLSKERTASLVGMWTFRDDFRSRTVFCIDGVFLFAESFFWVISLYLIANQDFSQLGILVVILSVLLAGIFFVIKNRLDAVEPQRIFAIVVVGYAASWLWRGVLGTDTDDVWLYPSIVVIAFLTTLFRLVFNKRFFDIARQENPVSYIVAKSYWSQSGLAFLYGLIGMYFYLSDSTATQLPLFYYLLTPISLLFLCYRKPALKPSEISL